MRSNLGRPELLRLFAILSTESSAPSHPAHAWFVDRYDRKVDALTRAFAFDQMRGRVQRSRDPQVLSRLLIGAWDGIQLQWLIDPSTDMERAMSIFFASWSPEPLIDI